MCTVSLIPLPAGGLRLVTNRDESRRRAPGAPPRVHEAGAGARAIYPVDADAGGTWVAATERGLVFALLNANPTPAPPLPPAAARLSRGLVIPRLAEAQDVEEAMLRIEELPFARLAPFRLLIADLETVRSASWSGERLDRARYPLNPMCLVSSGLGDERVSPRLSLFEQWMERYGPTPDAQDTFHRHVWPDRPEISVMMSRADARTVSVTAVELRATGTDFLATMHYRDDSGESIAKLSGKRSAAAGSA